MNMTYCCTHNCEHKENCERYTINNQEWADKNIPHYAISVADFKCYQDSNGSYYIPRKNIELFDLNHRLIEIEG